MTDYWSMLFVFVLATFIGLGVILLAASYLYQRFKGIILGEDPADNPPVSGA